MSRHDELRASWAHGQIWETRLEECAGDAAAWVPVGDAGRLSPVWDERQEYRQRPDDGAKQVPLVEQLRSVPRDAVLRIDTPNAIGSVDTRSIPVGPLCHQAADVLGMAERCLLAAVPDLAGPDRVVTVPLSDLGLDPENQYIGDLMILAVLSDSDNVNDQEREVLQRWIRLSQPPGAPKEQPEEQAYRMQCQDGARCVRDCTFDGGCERAQQENAPGPEAVLVRHAGGTEFVPVSTGGSDAPADEELDMLAKKHTKVHHQATHGWGAVPVAKLDHRAFARAVLAAAGVPVSEQTYYCPECGVMEGNWHLQTCSHPRYLVRRPDGEDAPAGAPR